jgi:putative ABC transport system ATP-binding protein
MSIELCDVSFHYAELPGQTVLSIPDWSLVSSEQAFIHGPSGSGKSTLLGLLSGLFLPSAGEITVLGQRLEKMSSRQRDRFRTAHIGYVFQQFNLIPYLSAFDNTLLASRFTKRKQTSQLHQEIKSLLTTLNIVEKDWYRPSRFLSIGQQQRVAITRALINKPELLIADEPTSSLDSDNTDAFMSLLMSIVEDTDMTLVFVSHDLSLSSYFNRVESLTEINQAEGLR